MQSSICMSQQRHRGRLYFICRVWTFQRSRYFSFINQMQSISFGVCDWRGSLERLLRRLGVINLTPTLYLHHRAQLFVGNQWGVPHSSSGFCQRAPRPTDCRLWGLHSLPVPWNATKNTLPAFPPVSLCLPLAVPIFLCHVEEIGARKCMARLRSRMREVILVGGMQSRRRAM